MRSNALAKIPLVVTTAVSMCALCARGAVGGAAGESVGNHPPPVTPTITAISPSSAVAGGAAFTLTINGMNCVAASMVNFGGSAPATTFVNSTQLTAAIPASSIASTGRPAVTVTNPAPDGGTFQIEKFIQKNLARQKCALWDSFRSRSS